MLKAIEWLPLPYKGNRRSKWALVLGILHLVLGCIFVALLTIAVRQEGLFVDDIAAGAAVALAATGMLVTYTNTGRCFVKFIEWMI